MNKVVQLQLPIFQNIGLVNQSVINSQPQLSQESLLTSVTWTSSSCTGSFSGEMALAVVEKTVNQSGLMDRQAFFSPVRCHDACVHFSMFSTNSLTDTITVQFLKKLNSFSLKDKIHHRCCGFVHRGLGCLRKSHQVADNSSWITFLGTTTSLVRRTQNLAYMVICWTFSRRTVLTQSHHLWGDFMTLTVHRWSGPSTATCITDNVRSVLPEDWSLTMIVLGYHALTIHQLGLDWVERGRHPVFSLPMPSFTLLFKRRYSQWRTFRTGPALVFPKFQLI